MRMKTEGNNARDKGKKKENGGGTEKAKHLE
jgi:hypothetical protein